MAEGSVCSLRSDYRGLAAATGTIQLPPLALIVGPNNGGKSQYLRSLVLLHAVRRALSSTWIHLDERTQARGSIAQALTALGFKDLAVEIAELTTSRRTINLTFRTAIWVRPGVSDLLRDELWVMVSRAKWTQPKGRTEYSVRFEIQLAFDDLAKDIVLSKLLVDGLPLGIELDMRRYSRLRPSQSRQDLSNIFGMEPGRYSTKWSFDGRPFDEQAFGRQLAASLGRKPRRKGSRRGFSDPFELVYRLSRRILTLLPSVVYIGPIRMSDDREYSVGSEESSLGVGRFGQLTWLQLTSMSKFGGHRRTWLEAHLNHVLGLSRIRGDRTGPTTPRVTARFGRSRYALHSFGLGTSQVLPILVQLATSMEGPRLTRGYYGGESDFVVIEEPESHLHPGAQRALALAFIDYVREGGRLVLETHSEILVRAIEAAIARKALSPTMAGVNWVDVGGKTRVGPRSVSFLEFDANGNLGRDLPAGFDQVVTEIIESKILGGSVRG